MACSPARPTNDAARLLAYFILSWRSITNTRSGDESARALYRCSFCLPADSASFCSVISLIRVITLITRPFSKIGTFLVSVTTDLPATSFFSWDTNTFWVRKTVSYSSLTCWAKKGHTSKTSLFMTSGVSFMSRHHCMNNRLAKMILRSRSTTWMASPSESMVVRY